MGRVEGKVAFVTGAARGQGRSHAVRLAAEGADIVAVDRCADLPTVPYDLGTEDDLAETARLVEEQDRRCLTVRADVRDLAALEEAAGRTVAEFGRLDVVVANAGILTFGRVWELDEETWTEMIQVNLEGVWKTVRATVPRMIEAGNGGSVIMTSSTAGKRGARNFGHYAAAKHGVVGLAKSLAIEGAEYNIRANTVHPTTVGTRMALNDATYKVFFPDLEGPPTQQQIEEGFGSINLLPVPFMDPVDVSNAVVYLASDESRYVTASELYVDTGTTERG